MMKNGATIACRILVFFSIVLTSFSGTLDEAPFRVVLPASGWVIDESASKDMGKGVYLLATITQTNSTAKSLIIKTQLKGNAALADFSAGARDSLSTNSAIQRISEEDIVFLSHKARRFTFEVKHDGEIVHNESTLFVVGKTGWGITCVDWEKDTVKQMRKFFEPRAKRKP